MTPAMCIGRLISSDALLTFGRSNSQAGGCDVQQPEREFRLPILYRPTNTESVSLHTYVVLVRAMLHQVQDVAEAY